MSRDRDKDLTLLSWLRSSGQFDDSLLRVAWTQSENTASPLLPILSLAPGLNESQRSMISNLFQQSTAHPPNGTPDSSILPSSLSSSQRSQNNLRRGPQAQAPLLDPISIPGYRIDSEISRGGMGVIYRAKQENTERQVAIKVLLQSNPEPAILSRFELEARALASLQHPNIVSVFSSGQSQSNPYLIMELIQGQTLEAIVRETFHSNHASPDFDWLRERFAELAEALDYCHGKGLIHRDLKPENLIINDHGSLKLIDFGLIKLRASELGKSLVELADKLSQTGDIVGTPAYMSPEQIDPSSSRELASASDIWSFGACLFFALTSRPVFDSQALVELLGAMLTQSPTSPSSINARIPKDLNSIVLACLQRQPDDRPSAAQLAHALRHAQSISPSKSKRGLAKIFLPLIIPLLLAIVLVRPLRSALKPTIQPAPQLLILPDRPWISPPQRSADPSLFRTADATLILKIQAQSQNNAPLSDGRWRLILRQRQNDPLELNSRPISPSFQSKENRLEATLDLAPGLNAIEVSVAFAGYQPSTQTWTILRDNRPPLLSPISPPPPGFDSEIELPLRIMADSELHEKAQDHEAHFAIFSEAGLCLAQTLGSHSATSLKFPIPVGRSKLRIEARDLCQNTASQLIELERWPSVLVGTLDPDLDLSLEADLPHFKTLKEALDRRSGPSRLLLLPGDHPISKRVESPFPTELAAASPAHQPNIVATTHEALVFDRCGPIRLQGLTFSGQARHLPHARSDGETDFYLQQRAAAHDRRQQRAH